MDPRKIINKFVSSGTGAVIGGLGGFLTGMGGVEGISHSVGQWAAGNFHAPSAENIQGGLATHLPLGLGTIIGGYVLKELGGNIHPIIRKLGSFMGGIGGGYLAGAIGGHLLYHTCHSPDPPGRMANYSSTGTPYGRNPGPYGGIVYTQKTVIPPLQNVPRLGTRLIKSPKPGK